MIPNPKCAYCDPIMSSQSLLKIHDILLSHRHRSHRPLKTYDGHGLASKKKKKKKVLFHLNLSSSIFGVSSPLLGLNKNSITTTQEFNVHALGPSSTSFTVVDHRNRKHENNETNDSKCNVRLKRALLFEPQRAYKGEDTRQTIVDGRNTHHALQDHFGVSIHQIGHG